MYIYFIDGRKAFVVKHQLIEFYKKFLSDYAHNMMTEYVTDINDDSIKVTLPTGELCLVFCTLDFYTKPMYMFIIIYVQFLFYP